MTRAERPPAPAPPRVYAVGHANLRSRATSSPPSRPAARRRLSHFSAAALWGLVGGTSAIPRSPSAAARHARTPGIRVHRSTARAATTRPPPRHPGHDPRPHAHRPRRSADLPPLRARSPGPALQLVTSRQLAEALAAIGRPRHRQPRRHPRHRPRAHPQRARGRRPRPDPPRRARPPDVNVPADHRRPPGDPRLPLAGAAARGRGRRRRRGTTTASRARTTPSARRCSRPHGERVRARHLGPGRPPPRADARPPRAPPALLNSAGQ